jgi:hypothetical protein
MVPGLAAIRRTIHPFAVRLAEVRAVKEGLVLSVGRGENGVQGQAVRI